MHRVEELADRMAGFGPGGLPGYQYVIPLSEVLSEVLKVGVSSKAVQGTYAGLLQKLGNEFTILLKTPLEDIAGAGPPGLKEAVSKMRTGDISIEPGYDGVFGKIRLFGKT